MTTKLKRKRTSPESDIDLHDLNARLDNINAKINPYIPYLLKIPCNNPVRLILANHQSVWIKDTPFSFAEGEVQYISNLAERGSSLIQAHGDWDDGNGSLSYRTSLPPLSKGSTATPQTAAKKIKLGDYTAKKASSGTPPTTLPSMAERAEMHKDTPTRKRQRDELEADDTPAKSKDEQVSTMADKKPRNTSLLSDAKPTLPPPIAPLPAKLREAVAELKRRKEAPELGAQEPGLAQPEEPPDSTEVPTKPKLARPAAQPSKEATGKEAHSSNGPLAPEAKPKQSRIIVFSFRKRRTDFVRLAKTTRPRAQTQTVAIRKDLALQTVQTPEAPAKSSKMPTSTSTSPYLSRPAGSQASSPETVRSAAKGPHPGFTELERRWNKLAIELKRQSQDQALRQSNPREALVLFLSSVVGFLVQVGIKRYHLKNDDDSIRMVLDGTHGVISRYRRERPPLKDCEPMEGLLCHLEAVVCRCQATLRKNATESSERLKAMSRCMVQGVDTMNPIALQNNFPRTWSNQQVALREGDKSPVGTNVQLGTRMEPRNPFTGPYTMELGVGSPLFAARVARLMIIEWCERENVKYDDELGVLGGV